MALKLFCDRCGEEIRTGDKLVQCQFDMYKALSPTTYGPTEDGPKFATLCNPCASWLYVLLFSNKKNEEASG